MIQREDETIPGGVSPPPKHLGWALLAIGVAVAAVRVAWQSYVPFQTEVCVHGLTTAQTWCSFDKPNGYQIAQACACVKLCAEDHFSLCQVNTTHHGMQAFRALLHDEDTVYLDFHTTIDDVNKFLADEGLL
jgi:hypothetical protein